MGSEAFAGQVVHDVIDHYFRSKKEGGLTFEPNLIDQARTIAREYIEDSERFRQAFESGDRAPQIHRQPLLRHFFHQGFDGAAKAEFRKTVETALAHFETSAVKAEIDALDPAFWELPPQGGAPWFVDQGIPVYANFDFALRTPVQTVLFDWKTGRLNAHSERDVVDQLLTYAAYAMDKWKAPAGQISLRAVWLAVGRDQVMDVPLDLKRLAKLRQEWRERFDELTRRRERARNSMERLFEEFPMTGIKKKKCRTCAFRFCEGYAQSMAKAEQDAANSASSDKG